MKNPSRTRTTGRGPRKIAACDLDHRRRHSRCGRRTRRYRSLPVARESKTLSFSSWNDQVREKVGRGPVNTQWSPMEPADGGIGYLRVSRSRVRALSE